MKLLSAFIILSITAAYLLLFPVHTQAQETPLKVIIINQIRGEENCCRPGTDEMVSLLNSTEEVEDLPFVWALRYDVLKVDEQTKPFVDLPKTQTLGVLLEVTPQLASDSGVLYKGDLSGSDWSQARHAFLIGYAQPERQKLIDTAIGAFHQRFNRFPEFTVSWMIDSWSLAYLRQKYGVRVHELTREQYETDGYTLYGGIFNQPYFPSKTHPLLPASQSTGLDLLIVRQTVSDIEKNYGSAKSYFTSQPNDYLANPAVTGFTYFTSLIETLRSQKVAGAVAVLGLENSQEWESFKDEYVKQLAFVALEQKAGRLKIFSPVELYEAMSRVKQQATILHSTSFPQDGALWYFGRNYRARIEIRDGQAVLTDYRIFPPFLVDPYIVSPAEKSQAYWILPYLLDSSQQFQVVEEKSTAFTGDPVRTDAGVARFGIALSQQPLTEFTFENDALLLKSVEAEILLQPELIEIKGSIPRLTAPLDLDLAAILSQNTDQYFTFARHPRFVMSPKESGEIVLGWENKQLDLVPMASVVKTDAGWQVRPNINVTQTQIDSLAHIFQPDRAPLPFEVSRSTFFWHNREAIAGRSSVRLFIDPRNILDRSVAPKTVTYYLTQPEAVAVQIPRNLESQMEQFFVDFTASASAQTEVQLTVDGNIIGETTPIRFYTDCTKALPVCLQNLEEGKGFLKVLWREKQQEYEQYLVNLLDKAQKGARVLLDRTVSAFSPLFKRG